jgi:hypothetical protein
MPAKDGLRLEDANDVAQLVDGTLRRLHQTRGQYSEDEILSPVRPDKSFLFPFQDIQLVAEDQNFKVLLAVRHTTKTGH